MRQIQLCNQYGYIRRMDAIFAIMHKLSEERLGAVRLIGTQSKVFYKCPPDLLAKSVPLAEFGLTIEEYVTAYTAEQKPWPKSMVPKAEYARLLVKSSPYYSEENDRAFSESEIYLAELEN